MMQRLQATVEAMIDALTRANLGVVVIVRREGRVEKWFANEPALQPLGYTLEEWLAVPVFQLVAPDQRQHLADMYERFVTDRFIPPVLEIRFVHKLGHQVALEFTAGRCAVPEGDAVTLIIRRVTHEQAQLSLLEADRIALVGALAAGFAHETNNPLTSVLLNLRSLRKQIVTTMADAPQTSALRCLDDITAGADRIAGNVRALQTLATRGGTQSLDLAAVVSAALRLAAPTLEPRAHLIRHIYPTRAVAGEESRIGQAVLAMLLFSSSGFDDTIANTANQIVATVEERQGRAVVEVSDNGRDLTQEEAQHAFEPFFRSSVRGFGVGVGLGVARSVAVTLGGEVALSPRDGGGAVITMKLPIAGE
jgi:C4-dicarboxylate-specific signal transduction histidine kinase